MNYKNKTPSQIRSVVGILALSLFIAWFSIPTAAIVFFISIWALIKKSTKMNGSSENAISGIDTYASNPNDLSDQMLQKFQRNPYQQNHTQGNVQVIPNRNAYNIPPSDPTFSIYHDRFLADMDRLYYNNKSGKEVDPWDLPAEKTPWEY